MIRLPDKVRGYRARVINAIIDYLAQITPRNTRSVRWSYTPAGAYAEVSEAPWIMDEVLRHFRVELGDDDQHVIVRGGRWSRRAGGAQMTVLLSCDDGPGGNADDYKTLSVSSGGYVVAALDSALAPTSLTVSIETNYPTGDATLKKRVLAKITVVSGHVTEIEQYHLGDIEDYVLIPDSAVSTTKSISYNSGGCAQIKDFESPSIGSVAIGDALILRDPAGLVKYADVSTISNALSNWSIPVSQIANFAAGCGGWWVEYAPDHHAHQQHSDFSDDSHNGVGGAVGYWRMGYGASRNYGTGIGNSSTSGAVIDLTNLKLVGDWECEGDYSCTGDMSSGGYVTATSGFKKGTATGITVSNWADGGILTGSTLVEKTISQAIADGDYVLVRPA